MACSRSSGYMYGGIPTPHPQKHNSSNFLTTPRYFRFKVPPFELSVAASLTAQRDPAPRLLEPHPARGPQLSATITPSLEIYSRNHLTGCFDAATGYYIGLLSHTEFRLSPSWSV